MKKYDQMSHQVFVDFFIFPSRIKQPISYRHLAKKMILRQGHPPQAFYFILSGKGVQILISFISLCFLPP